MYFPFQNNLLPSGDKTATGNSIVIHDVSRHHAGDYECKAENQVGEPAAARIDLKVLCECIDDLDVKLSTAQGHLI